MINHGLITGALFLLVGVIYERTHDRTIAKMGGLAAKMPVYVAVFGFFVFASAGLPGLSGFVGEFLALVGTFEVSPAAAAIAAFVMILAAGYLLYMFGRIVFGEVSEFFASLGDHLTDMTPVEILTLAPLAALVVVFGVQPGLLLDLFGDDGHRHDRRGRTPGAPIADPADARHRPAPAPRGRDHRPHRCTSLLAPRRAGRPLPVPAERRGRPLSWRGPRRRSARSSSRS